MRECPFLHFDIAEFHSKSGGLPLCSAGRWSAILFTPVFHRSQVLEVQGLDNLFIFLFTTVFFSISLFRDTLSCPVVKGTKTYSRGTVIDNKITASHTVCWTFVWQCLPRVHGSEVKHSKCVSRCLSRVLKKGCSWGERERCDHWYIVDIILQPTKINTFVFLSVRVCLRVLRM